MRCLVQNDRIRLQWQRDKDSFETLIYFCTICIIQPKNLIHCGIAAKLTQSCSQFPSIDERSSWRSACRVRLSPKQWHPKSRLIYYINSLITNRLTNHCILSWGMLLLRIGWQTSNFVDAMHQQNYDQRESSQPILSPLHIIRKGWKNIYIYVFPYFYWIRDRCGGCFLPIFMRFGVFGHSGPCLFWETVAFCPGESNGPVLDTKPKHEFARW